MQHVHACPLQHMHQQKHCLFGHFLACILVLVQCVNGMPCSFAFGGRGIYFGGKDVLVSELSGAFAITAETDKADRHGVFKSARISVQFGGAHLSSAQRYWV